MVVQECYIAIQYNNDDSYDAEPNNNDAESIGCFSTKQKAINKIIFLIKGEFDELSQLGEEELVKLNEKWFNEDDDEPGTWNDFYKIIKKNLQSYCESDGLLGTTYKIKKHKLDQ
jgi:hypothetical protein